MSNEENVKRFVELRLGISDMEIELLTRAETQHATELMVGQTQASLDISSRDLDPFLTDLGASGLIREIQSLDDSLESVFEYLVQ